MGIPDGIDKTDWDRVKELATRFCDAAEGTKEHETTYRNLFDCLNELESRYGPLPSILATRADFADDYENKERLLRRAYDVAVAAGDRKNSLYIAHSLVAFYLGELFSIELTRQWLDRLDKHLLELRDSDYAKDALEFRRKLQELDLK